MTTSPKPRAGSRQRSSDASVAAAATAVAASVNIISVRFLNFSALTAVSDTEDLPEKVEPKIGFTEPEHKRKGNVFTVRSTFLCRLQSEHGDPAAPLFDLRATTELVYVHDPERDFSEDDIRAFARINAPFNAWSYWRELTQSSLARLGLPAFPLPLFRVSDVSRLMMPRKETVSASERSDDVATVATPAGDSSGLGSGPAPARGENREDR